MESSTAALIKKTWMGVLVDVPLLDTHEDDLTAGFLETREHLGIGSLKPSHKDWVVFYREPKTANIVIAAGPFVNANDATAALISRVANDRAMRLLLQGG